MEKKDIYRQIGELEDRMGSMSGDLASLKKQIILLLEENKRMSIENQQLRKLFKNESVESSLKEQQTVGEGHENLTRLYHEGFHICNVYYGHLRTEGDCLFCLSFLHK